MAEEDNNLGIVDLLITVRTALASLYQVYETTFPKAGDFWHEMVVSNKAYAQVLAALKDRIRTGEISLNTEGFSATGLKELIASATLRKEEAKKKRITSQAALEAVFAMETATYTRSFFDVFVPQTPEMQKEMDEIKDHTREHRQRIAGALLTEQAFAQGKGTRKPSAPPRRAS